MNPNCFHCAAAFHRIFIPHYISLVILKNLFLVLRQSQFQAKKSGFMQHAVSSLAGIFQAILAMTVF